MTDPDSSTALSDGADAPASVNSEATGPHIFGDSTSPTVAMIARARERGYVTHDEIDGALRPGKTGTDHIEDAMTALSELGIAVVEVEESEEERVEVPPEASPSAVALRTGSGGDDHGRTDDPIALYLRDMGRRPLLTREGEHCPAAPEGQWASRRVTYRRSECGAPRANWTRATASEINGRYIIRTKTAGA